jgi:N-acetyl-alpha-D-muramate 1-phosphate uridylyltransferase
MSIANNAMVLAAGRGERMRPLTASMPKPLVRLAGRPLIDHVLDRLGGSGVERVVVNVHHLADLIEQHLAERLRNHPNPAIEISDELDERLDTGGGVARALPALGPGPFFIHNSDSIWSEGAGSTLDRMRALWRDASMDALLLLAPISGSIGYSGSGDFSMTPDGRLGRRKEKEIVPFAFTGVSLCHPRLFADAPKGAFSLNLLWDRALAAGRVHGVRHDGLWMHVGTPEALAEAETWFERV